jgi:hypothetical protein
MNQHGAKAQIIIIIIIAAMKTSNLPQFIMCVLNVSFNATAF